MTTKIYGPWIKWNGGECPVPRDQKVTVKLRNGSVRGPGRAVSYQWGYHGDDDDGDIMEYCVAIEHPDLEAAESLLRANGYTVIPPAKPLTFEDVVPLTEAPQKGTEYWIVSASTSSGAYRTIFDGTGFDSRVIQRRSAYLEKEHALVAARHIFGLKGGEL